MTREEKRVINSMLADVAAKFGLKIKLTVNNAQQLIEENYKKVQAIETSINSRLKRVHRAA